MIVSLLKVVSRVSPNGRSSHPSKFAVVSKLWAKSIQPITYRECNLVDEAASRSFLLGILKPVLGGPGPGRFVTVLSFSFYPGDDEGWWKDFYHALPEMTNIKIFCLAYSHEIVDSIERYASMAAEGCFSSTLERVYMRPVESEYSDVCCSFILIAGSDMST